MQLFMMLSDFHGAQISLDGRQTMTMAEYLEV
jgi:hypothetical protein